MKFVVYALCGNEELMITWFLRYYKEAGAEKIVVYLNATSKDSTRKFLEAEPLVELHQYDTDGVLRDDIHQQMKNTIWKQDKWGDEDWALVVDCDEFIVGANKSLVDTLKDLNQQGITVPLVHGYNIIGDQVIGDNGKTHLFKAIPYGLSTEASGHSGFGKNNYGHGPYHKSCLFRPAFVKEMNYNPGAHDAKPTGKVEKGKETLVHLLHAKWAFGTEYVMKRPFNLSKENLDNKWGTSFLDESFIKDYHGWAMKHRERLFNRVVIKKDDPYPTFSQDWFSNRIPQWKQWFAPFKDKPVKGMEIGVFEGRSSLWLLDNILTHFDARLFAVDTFMGGDDQIKAGLDLGQLRKTFENNISAYSDKVRIYGESSQTALPKLTGNFDFIYIDGSHLAADVFIDIAQSWRLLRVGGMMLFDDYAWRLENEPFNCPYPAINAFLYCFQGRCQRLPSDLLPMSDLQLAVTKTRE